MTNDRLQLAISQYLDGTLPAEQRAELEQALAADESARRMLDESRALDGALKQSLALPEVRWDRLAAHLSAVVAERGESMRAALSQPIDEQTEYAITQFLDGELPADEQPAMQVRLESDPAARQVAEDYRSLDRLLKTECQVPAVNWDMLTGQIADSIDEAAHRARWSIGWMRGAATLAMAACIVLGIGLVFHFYMPSRIGPAASVFEVREVAVLTPENAATGKPVIDISVSAPSPSVDGRYSFAAAGVVEDSAAQLTVRVAENVTPPAPDSFLQ